MSDSLVIQVAEGVKTALNSTANAPSGGWVLAFTAQRQYVPVHSVDDLETLTVTVIAGEDNRETNSRSTQQRDLVIQVGVQKHYASETEVDTLMRLSEQIAGTFGGDNAKVSSVAGVRWISTRHIPLANPEQSQALQVFTSAIGLTFRAVVS